MKKSLITIIVSLGLLLGACAGSEYDAEIEEVIDLYKNDETAMMWMDEEQITRENADISVYEGGRYIKIGFFDLEDGDKTVRYEFYERSGDTYEWMPRMNQTDDRLGLADREPEYIEREGTNKNN
ncbi:cystatin-like fold lipoprotein [Shouchella hunanensis]|uniref:Cystatin-like fold lipoprotein n=1 Tax=Shouchella hunanensis TaxID=766894 RepID=A0ABY7WD12_9BACI|nr:cystatin-like fold lipoprotein [Shouchella hunanensis]WDF05533.1 cystatin-like fold lipoprotein [Shouchella hunanensis]